MSVHRSQSRSQSRTTSRSLAPLVFAALFVLAIAAACSGPSAVNAVDPGANGAEGVTEPTTKLPHPVPTNESATSDRETCVLVDLTFDHDVTIPSGADCSFTRVSVHGDVVVSPGATLDDVDGTIDGDVLVYPAATFSALRTTIGGGVEAERSARVDLREATIDGDVETQGVKVLKIVGGTVDGDVEVDRGREVTIKDVSVLGDVEISEVRGSGAVSVLESRIQGDLEVDDNARPVHLIGNYVGGDLEADGNRELTVSDNVIDGDLECEGNRPAPVGSGNSVGGDIEGQCVGLDADPVPSVISVTIDQGDLTLAVGDATSLTATVVTTGGADDSVAWDSSDETVATIGPDGLLTATGEGTTAVTATSTFGESPNVAGHRSNEDDHGRRGRGAEGARGRPTHPGSDSGSDSDPEPAPAPRTVSDTITVTVTASGPREGADPVISSFEATVVQDSRLELTWSATDADAYDVHALLDGDPADALAIDTDLTGTAITIDIPTSDRQTLRLTARGDGGETTSTTTPTNVVTSSGDYDPYDLRDFEPEDEIPGTLRSVLLHAPTGSVIGFASDVTEVLLHGVDLEPLPTLTADAHLIVRNDVTISGPLTGVTIRGVSGWTENHVPPSDPLTWRSRILLVPPGTNATLEHLTLTDGEFIYFGGGIQNHGTLTLNDVTVTNNRAIGSGGGIHNTPTGTLTLNDSTVTGNRAATDNDEIDREWYIRGEEPPVTFSGANGYGGGIWNDPGGTVTLTNSDVTDNEARISGGGIYNLGTVDLDASDVTSNVADFHLYGAPSTFSYGGGIYSNGTLTAQGGTIAHNTVASQGGGLFHQEQNAISNLWNVTIEGNLAGTSGDTGYGGGILHRYYETEVARLDTTGSDYGIGNVPEDLYESPQGPRPAVLQFVDPFRDLPNPDDRNR